MAINPYINVVSQQAKDMHADIIIEAVRAYGQNVMYLPRTLADVDSILNESLDSRFDSAIEIEMYIENIEGFDGEGALLTQFGLDIKDQANFIVARKRWAEEFPEAFRPLEGDLIWYPLTGSLFEIKFVNQEKIFYQLNDLSVFQMQCELFDYGREELNTGIEEIDAVETFLKSASSLAKTTYDPYYIPDPLDPVEQLAYTIGETVYVGIDIATATFSAEVKSFDPLTGWVVMIDVLGIAITDDILIGNRSGAMYGINDIHYNILPDEENTLSDNQDYQEAADAGLIIDFTNPFGG